MRSLYESIIKNTRIGKYAKNLHGFHIDDIVYSDGKQLKFFIITDIDENKDTITVQRIGREYVEKNYYMPDIKNKINTQEIIKYNKKSGYFWINNTAILKKWNDTPVWSVI